MDPRHPHQNSYPHQARHFFDPRQNFIDPRKLSTHATHAPTRPTRAHATQGNLADSPYSTRFSFVQTTSSLLRN